MKRLLATCLLLPLLLSACADGAVRDTLGLSHEAPDEFTVVSRPPLSLPPEFSLLPPRAGEAPRGMATDEQAHNLLTGKAPVATTGTTQLATPAADTAVAPVVRSDVLSSGGANLLKRAGAGTSNANIREQLGNDARTPADTSQAKTLMDKITGAEKNEPVVDAKKEAARLRDNKDAGKPITEGDVPTQDTKRRSLIDRIF